MRIEKAASRILTAPLRAASALTVEPALKVARLVAGGKNPFPNSIARDNLPGGAMERFIRASLGEQVKGKCYDFKERAGQIWKNSVVGIALNWLQRTYPEAPLCIEKMRKGRWETEHEHEILDLLENPNPYWTSDELWCAILLSWVACGNAYLVKVRSRSGNVVELWWVPWWMIEPRWEGSAYISYYEYTVNGTIYRVELEDVVHLRNGVDAEHTRKGLSDLQASLREIAGDNEAVTYHAAILYNMGIPGLVFVPKEAIKKIDEDDKKSFLADFKSKFRGERIGEPLVLTLPWEIQTPGFTPDNLALEKLIRFYESRIAAALGIPAVTLGILVGLETSTAKASYSESLAQAYRSCLRPLHRKVNLQLTKQLMVDFDNPRRVRLARDYSEIPECQGDQNKLYERITKAVGNRAWMTINEGRAMAKKPRLEDKKYDELPEAIAPTDANGEKKPTPNNDNDDDSDDGTET